VLDPAAACHNLLYLVLPTKSEGAADACFTRGRVVVVASITPALAAVLAPNEIQTTFFTVSLSLVDAIECQIQDVFTADGKMTREPVAKDSRRQGRRHLKSPRTASARPGRAQRPTLPHPTAGDNKWS